MPTEDFLLLLFFWGGSKIYVLLYFSKTHFKDKWHPHPLHRPFMSSYTDIILLLTWNKLLLLFFLLPSLGAVICSGSVSGDLNKSPCGKQECKCTTQKLFRGHCNPAFTWFTLQFTVRNHIYFVILYTTSCQGVLDMLEDRILHWLGVRVVIRTSCLWPQVWLSTRLCASRDFLCICSLLLFFWGRANSIKYQVHFMAIPCCSLLLVSQLLMFCAMVCLGFLMSMWYAEGHKGFVCLYGLSKDCVKFQPFELQKIFMLLFAVALQNAWIFRHVRHTWVK